MKSYSNQRRLSLIFRYILLIVLAILWILPIVWIVLASYWIRFDLLAGKIHIAKLYWDFYKPTISIW